MKKPFLIIAGQSNAITRGVSGPVPAAWASGPDVQFWNGSRFEPYDTSAATNWGPEVGYAAAWRAAGSPGGRLRIVKHAVGNTQLAPQSSYGDLGADGMDWHPSTNNSLFAELVRKVDSALGITPGEPELTLLWVHGEADSRLEAASKAYPEHMRIFVATLERRLGRKLDRIALSLVSLRYAEAHRERQRIAARGIKAAVIDGANYPHQSDGIHLDRTGAYRLGQDAYGFAAGMPR